jgi:anthranilate phosphoribosyltransferase
VGQAVKGETFYNSAPHGGCRTAAAGLAADFREGARLAAEAIDSGAAARKLDALITFCSR